MEGLKGVQWIPGEGAPDVSQWPEVYRRIREAGKLIQVFGSQYPGGLEIIDVLADQLGSAKGIVFVGDDDLSQDAKVEKFLAKYGAI